MSDGDSDRALRQILDSYAAGNSYGLTAGLRDPDYRGVAARLLARQGDAEAVPKIRLLLDAADPKARLGAVRALASLGSSDDYDRILELARSDPHPNVRLWSIAAVGELRGPGALEFLLPLLDNAEWDTRRAAAFALGKLGCESAAEPLRQVARVERFHRRGVYRRALHAICADRNR